jgi:hypothetical protein
MNILSKKYRDPAYLRFLSSQLRSKYPVEYIVMDDFLHPDFYAALIQEINSAPLKLRGDMDGRQIYQIQ